MFTKNSQFRNFAQKLKNCNIDMVFVITLAFSDMVFFISQPANVRAFLFVFLLFVASTDRVLIYENAGIARVFGCF